MRGVYITLPTHRLCGKVGDSMKGIKANTEYQGKWTGSKRKERKAARKQRIIEAFTTDNDVEVIPAEYDIKPVEAKILRVAAYARVSTDQESQADSYQTQKEYYKKYITNHDGWEYVDTYADEGRSGTNVLKREHFKEMIEDCKAGHIDLIITKDIRRFARNVLDCLSYVRMLKSLNPPVGVYFEDEHLNTLDRGNEAILALLSSVAQGESENKSEAIKWSYKHRFEQGMAFCPTWALLGYTTDEEGNMQVVPAEAEVHVYCNSPLKGPAKKQVCKVPCLGCRKCARYAPEKFTAHGFRAEVNYGARPLPDAADVQAIGCPTGCLLTAEEHLKIEQNEPDWSPAK